MQLEHEHCEFLFYYRGIWRRIPYMLHSTGCSTSYQPNPAIVLILENTQWKNQCQKDSSDINCDCFSRSSDRKNMSDGNDSCHPSHTTEAKAVIETPAKSARSDMHGPSNSNPLFDQKVVPAKRTGRPKGRRTTSHSHLIRPKRPRSAYNFLSAKGMPLSPICPRASGQKS